MSAHIKIVLPVSKGCQSCGTGSGGADLPIQPGDQAISDELMGKNGCLLRNRVQGRPIERLSNGQ